MRLLLDEMLSPAIARQLRDRGYDVLAVKEQMAWLAADDDQVIALAREQRRAVVTDNVRDFRPRAAVATLPGGPGHFGMVFLPATFRRTKRDIGRIVTALEQLLAARPAVDGLRDQETWLG